MLNQFDFDPDPFASDVNGMNEEVERLSPIDPIESRSANDDLLRTNTSIHDPFPGIDNRCDGCIDLPPQVLVETVSGESSGLLIDIPGENDDGSLTLVGPKHSLGNTELLDDIHLQMPAQGNQVPSDAVVQVVYIHHEHDRYFARIDPETAQAWRDNFNVELVPHIEARAGEEVAFTQQAGVPQPVMRHGVVGGAADKERGLLTLAGTEGTLGSSGAGVFDREGNLVGQVVAYDPKNHVNLMSSAEQILGDIEDFRAGVNMENRASPVSYSGAVAPIVRRSL